MEPVDFIPRIHSCLLHRRYNVINSCASGREKNYPTSVLFFDNFNLSGSVNAKVRAKVK
jgi:hypothetical protein